jgi:long-chain acyl-CoA synthetase
MTFTSRTLGERLIEATDRYGQAWFMGLAANDGTLTNMDRPRFLDLALRVAGWCRDKGVAPGDRAILCLENSPVWGAAYFGIILAGGVVVPVDTQSMPADAAYFLERTRARLVFAAEPGLFTPGGPGGAPTSYRDEVSDHEIAPGVLVVKGLGDALDHTPLAVENIHRGVPDDPAALIFTSGTTGRPKAVTLTHANLLSNVESVESTGLVLPDDNFLAVLPLHHAYPCMVNLLVPLFLGVSTTFVETLKPEAILAALKTARVSLLVLTPQYVGVFYRRILKRFEDLPLGSGRLLLRLLSATAGMNPDPLGLVRRAVRRGVGPAFRFFLTGGAKCEPEVIEGMAALGIAVQEGYGLSETAPLVSFNRPGRGRPGSVGTPLPGVEVMIDAPDAEGFGEILVRGLNVMAGYFEDPDSTARVILGGWFHTGDQGRLDREGALYVRGRERDIIVLPSGKKFPAEEVEAHYRQAPSIGDICVLPGEGGSLRAVITPNGEYFRVTDSPDVRHNIRWDLEALSRSLPPYKRVGNVLIVPGELPKTRLGKIKRHLVEKMLERGQADSLSGGGVGADGEIGGNVGDAAVWPGMSEGGRKALAAIRQVAGLAAVTPESHLELDLGLDSLKRIELLTLVEDALGLQVPEERFQRLMTAREVIELAGELAGEATGGMVGDGPVAAGRPHDLSEPGAARATAEALGLAMPLPPLLAAKVRLDFGFWGGLATRALWAIIHGAARLGFGLEVRGVENIPDGQGGPGGAAIICPNHASFLDGFMVFAAVPQRIRMRLYFLGLARFFDLAVVRRLAALFRLIAVDAGRISETMRLSAFVLRHGKLLCVFPEGGRTPTGELQEFRKGPVILSREFGAPVVPVAITGTLEAWPVGGKLRLHKVTVTFGRPFVPASPEDVREAVGRLLEQAGDTTPRR